MSISSDSSAEDRARPRLDVDYSVRLKLEFIAAMPRYIFKSKGSKSLKDLLEKRINELMHKAERPLAASTGKQQSPLRWTAIEGSYIDPNHPESLRNQESQPIQIVSPLFPQSSQVRESLLKLIFNADTINPSIDHEILLEVNASCNFSVQIGRTGEDYDFRTIRNLSMLVLVFEGEIDKILGDHTGYMTESVWAKSNSRNSTLKDFSLEDKCRHLLHKCFSIEDVADAMCADPKDDTGARHFYKYNFMHLLTEEKVIEFRQHDATVDAKQIVFWTKFVCSLVSLASVVQDRDLFKLISANATGPVHINELFSYLHILSKPPLPLEVVADFARKAAARGVVIDSRLGTLPQKLPDGISPFFWWPRARTNLLGRSD
ncbi:MAG: hypothetical protein M1825_003737 [Sarcosagium campestre]|nr:MAG: hypothetical protein M1825_003737 [Sarcosagium campestre]